MGTATSTLQTLIGRAASAYTAGPAVGDLHTACERAARENLATTVCYWNSPVESPAFVAQCYLDLLQLAADLPTDSYLSMKAPALGFNLELLRRIIEEARCRNRIIHFDAMAPDTV